MRSISADRRSAVHARGAWMAGWPVLLLATLLLCAAAPERGEIRISTSEGHLIHLPQAPASILVADPAIADAATPTPTEIFLFGKKPGRTTLFALDAHGRQVASWQVVVGVSDAQFRETVASEVGAYPVHLAFTPSGAVLSGSVPTPQLAERVRAVAIRFVGDPQTLVDDLQLTGTLQVRLRVRVAEVSRTISKQLGINWDAVGSAGNVAFGLLTGRSVLDAAGNVMAAASGSGSLFAQVKSSTSSVTAVIDAMAAESLVRLLAEPTLIAASGETAKFLAGGEFPVPVSQGVNGISIDYRSFGVSLQFQPTVINDDLISLRVKPEVSTLVTNTQAGAVLASGFSLPALSVRQAETTIEIGSGQSFVIAGLLQDDISSQVSRYPGLGDIPILGPLFRSSSFQRNETELVFIVTPTLVRPVAGPGALRSPTDDVGAPSDVDLILRSRLSKAPAGPAVLDEIGSARFGGDAGFLLE